MSGEISYYLKNSNISIGWQSDTNHLKESAVYISLQIVGEIGWVLGSG